MALSYLNTTVYTSDFTIALFVPLTFDDADTVAIDVLVFVSNEWSWALHRMWRVDGREAILQEGGGVEWARRLANEKLEQS